MAMHDSEKIPISLQDCHPNLRSQIPDIPNIVLIFWTKSSRHFHCQKINFRKHKTNTNSNIYFQNAEREHKEKAKCVSDLTEGLIYMNRFHVPLLTYVLAVQSPSIIIL